MSFASPSNAPLTPSGVLTVSGINFASSDKTASIVVAADVCSTATWKSRTAVMCSVAVGTSTGESKDLLVTLQGSVGTRSKSFSFDGQSFLPRFRGMISFEIKSRLL